MMPGMKIFLLLAIFLSYTYALPTPSPPQTAYISVSIATLWTSPTKPRPIDTPALQNPAQIQQWLDSMTTAQYLDLTDSDRTQTQALYGTQVSILNATEEWYEIAVPDQLTPKDKRGYPGWVPRRQVVVFDEGYGDRLRASGPFAQVEGATMVPLYRDKSMRSVIMEISYATRLPILNAHGPAIQVALPSGKMGYLSHRDAKVYSSRSAIPYPTGEDLVKAGSLFLNRPYLWGGTSGFAFDCAGFTGTVYRAHGMPMARDSGAQATYMGHGVAVERESLKKGDLLFYATNVSDAKSIHHVAMYAGEGEMLEAYGAGTPVRRTAVRFGEEYWGARRYLKE